ncbi:MAG: hypothetical protein IKE46_00465 [Selenomonadaceae bacterium]|nr:hypothetical protein [Selenomonadaceae bacterium]
MKPTQIFDRNGREIKPSDRVKMVAEEFNALLLDSYGDDLPEGVLNDEDIIGTAQMKDGFFQVTDDNGEMLWDLSFMMKNGDTDPFVEVFEK